MVRPPHSLLVALVATSVVVTVALGWFGWRWFDSQRALDNQRARAQSAATADATADAIVAGLRGKLADAGDRLSAWLSSPMPTAPAIDGAVVFAWDPRRNVAVVPHGPLPFVPVVEPAGPPLALFTSAESVEFAANQPARASDEYRRLATSADIRVRAGALLRLGRVLRKIGDLRGALAAYVRLAALGDVRTDDNLPAALVGLDSQRLVLHQLGDREAERRVMDRLQGDLDGGRWLIPRNTANYYRDGVAGTARPDSWLLADAIAEVWPVDATLPPRGLHTFRYDGHPILVLWRASGLSAAVVAAFANDFLASAAPVGASWQLTDASNQNLAGLDAGSGSALLRVMGDADAPWTLRVWPRPESPAAEASRIAIVMMTAAVLMFLWGATYFMVRAMRREAEVSHLQSDFVAAVSHEFRSPLTTVRQMAEMLEMGRLTDELRRQQYYRVLVGEAVRLQRLVETLLNFGRMEAGRERYEFRDIDVASLVQLAITDVLPQAHEAGTGIEANGANASIHVMGDVDALRLALRNVIENAIKYSPNRPTVWVRWDREQEQVVIRVTDRGLGIAAAERSAIFGKFVRGRAAAESHATGTGVGLAMVQHIVNAHGGRIRVESEVGKGSTFTILLPAVTDAPVSQ